MQKQVQVSLGSHIVRLVFILGLTDDQTGDASAWTDHLSVVYIGPITL